MVIIVHVFCIVLKWSVFLNVNVGLLKLSLENRRCTLKFLDKNNVQFMLTKE